MHAEAVVWARPVERYRVLRALGARPSGKAQLAEDRWTGGKVVVHVGCWSARQQRDRAVRLQEAAWLVARIDHGNVLAVRDLFFAEDGRPCLVTEHVDGGSLADLLTVRGGWLPPHEAVAIAGEVLEGLAALHAAGMVHGALAPESVRVCPGEHGQPTVKIADVATAAGLPDPRLLGDGGSAWMRADVFAAAAMLESMIAGWRRLPGGPWREAMVPGPGAAALDSLLRHALGARSRGFECAEAMLLALRRIDPATLYASPEAALVASAPDLGTSGVRLVQHDPRLPAGVSAHAPGGRAAALDTTDAHRVLRRSRRRTCLRDAPAALAVLGAGLALSILLACVLLRVLR
jgi:serine/threonine protein kinase